MHHAPASWGLHSNIVTAVAPSTAWAHQTLPAMPCTHSEISCMQPHTLPLHSSCKHLHAPCHTVCCSQTNVGQRALDMQMSQPQPAQSHTHTHVAHTHTHTHTHTRLGRYGARQSRSASTHETHGSTCLRCAGQTPKHHRHTHTHAITQHTHAIYGSQQPEVLAPFAPHYCCGQTGHAWRPENDAGQA
jgi:hypothetical protein